VAKTRTEASSGIVYTLKDPRDLLVKYVGATTVPLSLRLAGHLTSPASEPLREWIGELKAAGLVPIIEPLRENVPIAKLSAAETAEIHARTMRREPLLNVNGKAAARRILEERAAVRARRRELAFWRATAARIRSVTGPLPPGFDAVVTLSDDAWSAIEEVADVFEAMEAADRLPPKPLHEITDPDNYLPEGARLMCELGRIAEDTDRLVLHEAYEQVGLDELWGIWEQTVRECVEATAGSRRFASRDEAGRYLALIRWYLAVIPPWRHLAYRCGIPPAGPEFHNWVTDDEDVRAALRIVEKREPFVGRAADDLSRGVSSRPGFLEILDSLTVVYSRRRPDRYDVAPVLRLFAVDGHLDDRMAKTLLSVDPDAVDHVYGPDHASCFDTDLNLPAGSAGEVIRRLEPLLNGNEGLRTLVRRVNTRLPIAAVPDISDGPHRPGTRAIVAALLADGRIKAPGPDAASYRCAVRHWWTPRARTRHLAHPLG
jgi:hypothetical protein